MMTMLIRLAQDADLKAIVDVFFHAVHELGKNHYTEEQLSAWASPAPNLERWKIRLASLRIMVVESRSQIVGFAGYGSPGHVDLLYVRPEFARRGVATSLLCEIEHYARRAGESGLHTEASLVALPFFERHGFVTVEEEEVSMGGTALRRFKMQKVFDTTQQAGPADRVSRGG